jgi:hypothetical protein
MILDQPIAASAAAQPALPIAQRDRLRQALSASSSSAGTASTQWCDHETGETSSAVTAQSENPARSSPRRAAAAATHRPASPVSAAAASHSGSTPAVCSTRASAPRRLWFAAFSTRPTRIGSAKVPPQNAAESAGARANPAATVPQHVRAQTAAAR